MKIKLKRILLVLLLVILITPGIIPEARKLVKTIPEDQQEQDEKVKTGGKDYTPQEYPKAYFMLYPNGVTEAVEKLDDINNPPEILLYSGVSNENGEIVLENMQSTGQLRIVETVPTGYTTAQNEYNVDLSKTTTTGFVNYKGFINPNTGRKALYLLLIVVISALVIVTIKKRTNLVKDSKNEEKEKKSQRKSKKTAAIFILIPALVFIAMHNTKADTKNFIITTKDSHGNKMPNVEVKVYAKPITVEQDYYIKFDANGGEFLDGTTEMIFRLPAETCTVDNFYSSLSIEDDRYLFENRNGATREGFYIRKDLEPPIDVAVMASIAPRLIEDSVVQKAEAAEAPMDEPTFTSGQVIYTEWMKNSDAHVVTVNGNGAYRLLRNKKLYSFKTYQREKFNDLGSVFYNEDNINGYYVGTDTNAECTHFPYGIKSAEIEQSEVYYACWNNKPDGVYINDIYVKGNMDNCFSTANPRLIDENTISFNQYTSSGRLLNAGFIPLAHTSRYLYIKNLATEGLELNLVHQFEESGIIRSRLCTDDSCVQAKTTTTYPEITKLEIVNHGKVIVTITSSDIERTTEDSKDSNVAHNLIKNVEKRDIINNYFGNFKDTCIKESPEPIEIK